MRSILTLTVLILSSALAGCFDADTFEEQREAGEFHRNFNAEQFGDIYDGASETFRRNNNREEVIEFLTAVWWKLGRHESAKLTNFHVWKSTCCKSTTLVYQSRFSEGYAQETFVVAEQDGKLKLDSYQILSNQLVVGSDVPN